jgi:hypothetical protein
MSVLCAGKSGSTQGFFKQCILLKNKPGSWMQSQRNGVRPLKWLKNHSISSVWLTAPGWGGGGFIINQWRSSLCILSLIHSHHPQCQFRRPIYWHPSVGFELRNQLIPFNAFPTCSCLLQSSLFCCFGFLLLGYTERDFTCKQALRWLAGLLLAFVVGSLHMRETTHCSRIWA